MTERLIKIYPVKCAKCKELTARFMRVVAEPKVFERDKVLFSLVCLDCAGVKFKTAVEAKE